MRHNKHHNAHLQRAYNKSPNAFIFDVLELCDENQLDGREIFWISTLDSTNHAHGYNIAVGGLTSRAFTNLPEVRAKLSRLGRERYESLSEEERVKQARARRDGRTYGPLTDEQKLKIGMANSGENNWLFGKHQSDEVKQKIGAAISRHHKEGVYHQEKPIYQLDDYYQIVQFYPSISDAATSIGINMSGISSCLNGNYCRAGGYYWAYSEQFDLDPKEYERLHRKKSHQGREIIHYSMDMEKLREYTSVTQMSNAIHIDSSHLCKLFTKNGGIIVRAEGIFICNPDWR